MLVITQNAEKRLMDDLSACRRDNPVMRCFYMAFSKSDIPRQALFEKFLEMLNDVPDSYKAQVYICRNMDVFVLMQGFMQRQFAEFLDRLGVALNIEGLTGLTEVLEIGTDWERLEALCHAKIQTAPFVAETPEAAARRREEEKALLSILSTLDPELVGTIAERRARRRELFVMVADDDQIARTLVSNSLREVCGFATARDGRETLAEYVATAPDALFLDIGLPDISGLDVLESLFQIDPGAYIIMFSGRKDKGTIMRALDAGAQGFVGKPFTREKLLQYVERSPHFSAKRASAEARTGAAG